MGILLSGCAEDGVLKKSLSGGYKTLCLIFIQSIKFVFPVSLVYWCITELCVSSSFCVLLIFTCVPCSYKGVTTSFLRWRSFHSFLYGRGIDIVAVLTLGLAYYSCCVRPTL